MSFGDLVRWWREAFGLTRPELAERSGLGLPAVLRIESGELTELHPGVLVPLLRSLCAAARSYLEESENLPETRRREAEQALGRLQDLIHTFRRLND